MDPAFFGGRNFDTLSMPQDIDLTSTGPQQTRKPNYTSPSGGASVQHYSPQALLNPKAAASAKSKKPESEPVQEDYHGTSRMIENLHNVAERDDAPTRKRKAPAANDGEESDEERKKTKMGSVHIGSGGTISTHLKDERKQMATEGNANTIDLTNDDGDDDLLVVKDTGNEEICLGLLHCSANVDLVPTVSAKASGFIGRDHWPRTKIEYKRPTLLNNVIELWDRSQKKFGRLEPRVAAALTPLLDGAQVNKIRLKMFLADRKKKQGEMAGQRVSESLKVDVFMYSPRRKADQIGRFLSTKQLFLARPLTNPGTEIFNPHDQLPNYGPKPGASVRPQSSTTYHVQRTVEEMRTEASAMFDNLAKAETLPEMAANEAIITSDLMPHQKQALHFLMEHERSDYEDQESPQHSLWKFAPKPNGRSAWYNVITGHEVMEKPQPIQGGILADVMGLGKTLSILALIAETREASRRFRREEPSSLDGDIERNAKGTLIVCPKSVLSNWQEQIKIHTAQGEVKVYTYHGTNRMQDVYELSKCDIVLTSYDTAGAEFRDGVQKKRALRSINWFRIVLDEAHTIRNQTTSISKACCALLAQRRWAVTGTPVQNNLYDLGALIKFLRLPPFENQSIWSQYIMAPFKTGDVDVIQKLQVLVGSITLRRLKSTVGLPDRTEHRERLTFSPAEALLYKQFATKSRSQFHNITQGGNALRGKAYAHVLKSLSRLRSICAHGREMLSEEDMKEIEGDDPNNAIVLDIGDEPDFTQEDEFVTDKQAYDTFSTMRDSEVDSCESCRRKLGEHDEVQVNGAIDTTGDGDSDSYDASSDDEGNSGVDSGIEPAKHAHDLLGFLTPCFHLICTKCESRHRQDAKATMTTDEHYQCPYCDQYMRFGMFPLRRSALKRHAEQKKDAATGPKEARWDETSYSGPHTKVQALLSDLQNSAKESAKLPEGEPPIRSVVFSGWTAYLDLIEYALTKHDIGFARIDGSMSVKQRSQNLRLFNEFPEITVLLVSIKAGGQGLNFTSANKVYVMEPQFNPGVEQQAVDRVHRIGQTREVEIKHYIMNDSVEEGILKLQEKKEALARMATEKKRTKGEEAKERMQQLRELFK